MDNEKTKESIISLSKNIAYALENNLTFPQNFLGVGGAKIFRDLIYMTGGLMREDYKFYKKNGFLDYPQKHYFKRLSMTFVGRLLSIPTIKKNTQPKMVEILVKPYKEIVNK